MKTMKTIYISGPITDPETGRPREGWQKDFLDAEQKLRRMGFHVINPVDIAREVEEANRWQYECTSHPCNCNGEPTPPGRADYIMACLQRMKMCHSLDRLHGVYVIGNAIACQASHGVQLELLMADLLGLPIYADCFDGGRVNCFVALQPGKGILELLND